LRGKNKLLKKNFVVHVSCQYKKWKAFWNIKIAEQVEMSIKAVVTYEDVN